MDPESIPGPHARHAFAAIDPGSRARAAGARPRRPRPAPSCPGAGAARCGPPPAGGPPREGSASPPSAGASRSGASSLSTSASTSIGSAPRASPRSERACTIWRISSSRTSAETGAPPPEPARGRLGLDREVSLADLLQRVAGAEREHDRPDGQRGEHDQDHDRARVDLGQNRHSDRPNPVLFVDWLTDQSIGSPPNGTAKERRSVVDLTLTDEQKDLRELAHSFAEKDIRKVAWEYDKDGTWPQEIVEKAWEIGLMNTHIAEEYGGAGARLPLGLPDRGGDGLGLLGHRHLADGQRPRRDARSMLGGSEEVKKEYLGMLTEAPKLASFCLTEPDAGSDVSGHEDDRRQEGRQVRHQRLQVLHHQRRLRRLVHGLRQDRQGRRPPRHLGLRRPQGRHGDGGQEGGQAGPARLQHRHDHLQRDRDPRRQPAGRGEPRLQAGDDDPRPHPPRRLGDGRRHRPGRVRVRRASTPRSASSSASRSRCTRRSPS